MVTLTELSDPNIDMSTTFWGVALSEGKKYTQIVEQDFHISMAALEYKAHKDRNNHTRHVGVMLRHNKADGEFVLCTLIDDTVQQQYLDLNFSKGEEITFFLNGEGVVYLTGYTIPDEEFSDEEMDSADEEMDSADEESFENSDDAADYGKRLAIKEAKLSAGLKRKKAQQHESKNKRARHSDEEDTDSDEDDDSSDYYDFIDDEAEETSDDGEDESDEMLDDDDSLDDEKIEEFARMSGSFQIPSKQNKNDGSPSKKHKQKPEKKQEDTPGKKQKDTPGKKQKDTPGKKQKDTPGKKHKKSQGKNQNDSIDMGDTPGKKQKDTPGKKQKDTPGKKNKDEKKTEKTPSKKSVLQGNVVSEELKVGHGPEANHGKAVHVYYTGKLQSGKVFDSATSGKPFMFKLGKSEVIKGWDVGVKGMKVGGKRRLTVPPQMGYGNQKTGPIPSNSTLIFDVELKSVS